MKKSLKPTKITTNKLKIVCSISLFFLLIFLNGTIIFTHQALAQNNDPASKAKNELAEIIGTANNTSNNPLKDLPDCLPKDELEKTPYVITILEEPIIQKGLTSEELKAKINNKEPFISQLCYRNTYSAGIRMFDTTKNKNETLYSESETVTTLSTSCANITTKNVTANGMQTITAFSCQQVEVLLSRGGTSLISGYIRHLYTWAAGVVGIIAVFMIVYSGIQISVAGGDQQTVENAKNRIVQSLLGIAVMFLAGLILYTANPTFFTKESAEQEVEILRAEQESTLNN